MWRRLLFFLLYMVDISKAYEVKKFLSVCYFPNWSPLKNVSTARLGVDGIDPRLCSHLMYAFVKIDANLNIFPTEPNDLRGNYEAFNGLKEGYDTVTMLSVGGQLNAEIGFQLASASDESRKTFARNIIDYVRKYNFDGIDIDWEYPRADEKHQFTLLLKVLWEAIADEAETTKKKRLLLSAAVGVGRRRVDTSYEVTEIVKYLDFLNVMTYDFHGSWNRITGFKSPLFSRKSNLRFDPQLSQEWAINYWIEKGAPRDKLVLGLTAAGNTYTLSDPNQHEVGSSTEGAGNKGPYTQKRGFLSYYEICEYIRNLGYEYVWDEEQSVPYIYMDNQWIGFDDYRSITKKTEWMINNSLAGAMMWSLDLDDFNNICKSGKFPLTTAMRYAIENAEVVTIPTSTITVTIPTTHTIAETTQPTTPSTTEESAASHLVAITMVQMVSTFIVLTFITQYLSNIF